MNRIIVSETDMRFSSELEKMVNLFAFSRQKNDKELGPYVTLDKILGLMVAPETDAKTKDKFLESYNNFSNMQEQPPKSIKIPLTSTLSTIKGILRGMNFTTKEYESIIKRLETTGAAAQVLPFSTIIKEKDYFERYPFLSKEDIKQISVKFTDISNKSTLQHAVLDYYIEKPQSEREYISKPEATQILKQINGEYHDIFKILESFDSLTYIAGRKLYLKKKIESIIKPIIDNMPTAIHSKDNIRKGLTNLDLLSKEEIRMIKNSMQEPWTVINMQHAVLDYYIEKPQSEREYLYLSEAKDIIKYDLQIIGKAAKTLIDDIDKFIFVARRKLVKKNDVKMLLDSLKNQEKPLQGISNKKIGHESPFIELYESSFSFLPKDHYGMLLEHIMAKGNFESKKQFFGFVIDNYLNIPIKERTHLNRLESVEYLYPKLGVSKISIPFLLEKIEHAKIFGSKRWYSKESLDDMISQSGPAKAQKEPHILGSANLKTKKEKATHTYSSIRRDERSALQISSDKILSNREMPKNTLPSRRDYMNEDALNSAQAIEYIQIQTRVFNSNEARLVLQHVPFERIGHNKIYNIMNIDECLDNLPDDARSSFVERNKYTISQSSLLTYIPFSKEWVYAKMENGLPKQLYKYGNSRVTFLRSIFDYFREHCIVPPESIDEYSPNTFLHEGREFAGLSGAANYLGIGYSQVGKLIENGSLRPLDINGESVFLMDDLIIANLKIRGGFGNSL